MPKAGRMGLCLAIVGLALATQGCWDDGDEHLTLLGEGGCRTADGGHGDSSTIETTTVEDCQTGCFAGDAPCAAIEYNANNGMCEVHRQPIASFEHVAGVACYAMR
jgi:hypothetical protein